MAKVAGIAGIVLAAGFSRRLGRPKQLVKLAGETLVERAKRIALEAGLDPVVLVLSPAVLDGLKQRGLDGAAAGCTLVLNEQAEEGMASSLRRGLAALQEQALVGVVVMTCDQVAVTPEHLRALCAKPDAAAGSGYAGLVGVPAYFPASRFVEISALRGDRGPRRLLQDARAVPLEALVLDVDTEEDLARAEAWVMGHGSRS